MPSCYATCVDKTRTTAIRGRMSAVVSNDLYSRGSCYCHGSYRRRVVEKQKVSDTYIFIFACLPEFNKKTEKNVKIKFMHNSALFVSEIKQSASVRLGNKILLPYYFLHLIIDKRTISKIKYKAIFLVNATVTTKRQIIKAHNNCFDSMRFLFTALFFILKSLGYPLPPVYIFLSLILFFTNLKNSGLYNI